MADYKDLGLALDLSNWEQLNENFNQVGNDFEEQKVRIDGIVEEVTVTLKDQIIDDVKINWLSPVDTFANLSTVYPGASEGDTAMVRSDGKIYRWNGTIWKEIQDIDPTAINATETRLLNENSKVNAKISWTNVKSFGAKGDGITDDSAAIKAAFNSTVEALYFPEGTYIINIPAGTTHTSRDFIASNACKVKTVRGVNGKSVIKLGNGNCNEVVFRGFQGLFNYTGETTDVHWENMTIDFNWENNKNYHYVAQFEDVTVNGQQLAINAYMIRDMTIKDCVFIDQAGTNCINYRSSHLNSRVAHVEITNNKFLAIGRPAVYTDANNNALEAYHDHSTVSIHLSNVAKGKAVRSNVSNNYFEAAGHNGLNAIECFADYQKCENNEFRAYGSCYLPGSGVHKGYIDIRHNKFIDVIFAVNIWSFVPDFRYTEALGAETIKITDNEFVVSPFYHMYRPSYAGKTMENGIVRDYQFSCIKFGSALLKSIGKLIIKRNIFRYDNFGLTPSYNAASPFAGSAINFSLLFKSGELAMLTETPYIDTLDISENTFSNIWRNPIINRSYPKINTIKISRNHFENCFVDTAYNNPQASYIQNELFGSTGTAGYENYPFIKAYNKYTEYTDNRYIDIHAFSYGNQFYIYETNNPSLNPLFVFRDNVFDKSTAKRYDKTPNITRLVLDTTNT